MSFPQSRLFNPWAQPDFQTPQAPLPFGPANYGQPSPWDSPDERVSKMSPTAQAILSNRLALSPVRPGSGERERASLEENETDRRSTQSHQGLYESPEDAFAHASVAAAIPEIAAQEKAQQENRALFGMSLAQPHQADLAGPLSIAAHDIDNRNAIIKPQQYGMGEKEIREWAKQQQDDQRDIARTIIQASNAQKSGFLNEQVMQALGIKTALSNQAQDPTTQNRPNNFGASNWLRWTNAVDNTMKADREALSEGQALKLAINGSPAAQRGVPIMLGKMLTGSSRVPVQEVMMERGDPAFANTIEQKWNTLANGEITPSNKKEYMDFVNQLLELHKKGIQNHVEQGLQRGRPMGLADMEMRSYLQPQFTMPHTPQAAPASAQKAAPKVDIKALFEKALQDEKGD